MEEFISNLSLNQNITWDIVKTNPDKHWDYEYMGANPNITWDIIQANLDKPWCWEFIGFNINITEKAVETLARQHFNEIQEISITTLNITLVFAILAIIFSIIISLYIIRTTKLNLVSRARASTCTSTWAGT